MNGKCRWITSLKNMEIRLVQLVVLLIVVVILVLVG